MEFGTGYTNTSFKDAYHSDAHGYVKEHSPDPFEIERPIYLGFGGVGSQLRPPDIGQSVPEGQRFGSFLKTFQEAIRRGVTQVELSTGMGGGAEASGAESYGIEAREALRELARANEVEVVSVHSPVQIGNMSGYNPQERGFNDEHRKIEVEEVKKAIEFAGDLGGGAVVVHTGEFPRDVSDQPWARNPDGTQKFLLYDEAPGREVQYLVDDRTGKLLGEVRKSQVVREPEFKTAWDPEEQRTRWVDKDGKFLNENDIDDLFRRVPIWEEENTRFKSVRLTWDDFVKRADVWNKSYSKDTGEVWTPEEMFFRSQMETRILQSRGSSLFHGRFYDQLINDKEELQKALEYYEKLEESMPKDELWKIARTDKKIQTHYGSRAAEYTFGTEERLPSQVIKDALKNIDLEMKYTHEASASMDASADETLETLKHVLPVREYAKKQTSKSYAETAIHAMDLTRNNPHVKRDIFVAPENLFPEMGYGGHPDELIEMVKDARKKFVELLTEPYIESPYAEFDQEREVEGIKGKKLKVVPNPNYQAMNKEDAERLAAKHIRSTLDTQHLGMWWKHFVPLPGETKDQRRERFMHWYEQQIDKLQKEDIIGHIHAVDGLGGGHHHLPIGQGDLPVKKTLEYLKAKGYKGSMISEAWGEEHYVKGRIVTQTWKALGVPLWGSGYSGGGGPQRWTDVHMTYFKNMQSPYFVFGAYSPSNDWQLWSQVPME